MKYNIIVITFFLAAKLFSQVAEKPESICPILIGRSIPELSVYNMKGEAKSIKDLIKKPTVLLFYRGSWCPYCNSHLSDIANSENKIADMGYQIIAISPDDPQNLVDMESKVNSKIDLYSDKNADLIKAIGIAFKPTPKTNAYIVKKTKGMATEILPVPTVLVVNAKGEVLFTYINPDYTKRLSAKLLLSILDGLK